MAEKISLLKKDAVHGGQHLVLDIDSCDIILSSDTDFQSIIEEALKGGKYIVSVGKSGSQIHYISKTADGYFRDITRDNYNRNMPVYPFTDNAKWINNIDNYFLLLQEDEDAIKELEAIYGDEVYNIVNYYHKQIRAMNGSPTKSGPRPSLIFNFIRARK